MYRNSQMNVLKWFKKNKIIKKIYEKEEKKQQMIEMIAANRILLIYNESEFGDCREV